MKVRHVLEQISTWVKDIMKIVDVPVSMDQSGHAALPWTIVKYCQTTVVIVAIYVQGYY